MKTICALLLVLLGAFSSFASEGEAVMHLRRAEMIEKSKKLQDAAPIYALALKAISELPPEHLLRAEVNAKAGRFYIRMGQPVGAAKLLKESIAQIIKVIGKDAPRLADIYTDLTKALLSTGNFAEAETAARESLKRSVALVGENHAASVFARTLLATALAAQKKYKEAEKEHYKVISFYEKTLRPDNPEIIPKLLNFAQFYHRAKMYESAEREYSRIIAILGRDKLGRNPAEVASIFSAYADVQENLGNTDSAKKYRDESTKIIQNYLLRSLAEIKKLENSGDYEKAIQLSYDITRLTAQLLGRNNNKVIEYRLAHARLVSKDSEGEKGGDLFKRILGDIPKDNGLTRLAQLEYAKHLRRGGHFDLARKLIPKNANSVFLLEELGNIEMAAKNYNKAVRIFDQLILRLAQKPSALKRVLIKRAQLAKINGNFKELKNYIERAKVISESTASNPYDKTIPARLMAAYHISQHNYDSALNELTEILKIYGASYGPNHIFTQGALMDIAKIYAKRKEHTKALPIFERALKIISKEYGNDTKEHVEIYYNLGVIYSELRRDKDAISALQKSLELAIKHKGGIEIPIQKIKATLDAIMARN